MSRRGLSIESMAAAARAFDKLPRKPRRYGSRRRGAGTPKPQSQEPEQPGLFAKDRTGSS